MFSKTNKNKTISLRYILMGWLMAFILPIIFIYTFVGYSMQKENLINDNKSFQEQLEYSVINAMSMSNSGYDLLSELLHDVLKDKMIIFAEEFKKAGSPEKLNLEALRETLGGKVHLYINGENGITKYSTNKDDIGFDYKSLKDFYPVLEERRKGNEFVSDPFVTSQNSNVLTKYGFMPTENHKDLLQISVTSEDYKNALNGIDYNKVIEDMKKSPYISDIRVFGSQGKLINNPKLNIDDKTQKIVQSVANNAKNYIDDSGENSKKYIYIANGYGPNTGDVRKIVEITYDSTLINKILSDFKIKQLITIVIATMILSLIIILISSKALNPLVKLKEGINKIAEGDLTVKFTEKGKGEIRLIEQSINIMANNILHLIENISKSAQTTAKSSEQLNISFEEISKAVEQTASSTVNVASVITEQGSLVVETSNQVEIVSEGIETIKSNIDNVSVLIDKVVTKSDDGMNHIVNTVDQIKNIRSTSEEVRDIINVLDKSSNEITGIIGSIESIAEQTHLLALNASIEAARAGEYGKGFAVVASEVGKLADQSNQSAKTIRELILNNQQNTKLAVEAMEKGMDSIASGEDIAENAGVSFKNITELINNTKENINVISSNSNSLEENKNLISQTIKNLSTLSDEVINETNSTAATTEEQSASIEEVGAYVHSLSNMADGLVHDLEKFKI